MRLPVKLSGVEHHVGTYFRHHTTPVAVGVVVQCLAVVPELDRVIGPFGFAAFICSRTQRQVVTKPVGWVAKTRATAAGDTSRRILGDCLVVLARQNAGVQRSAGSCIHIEPFGAGLVVVVHCACGHGFEV